jgi:hypothetical protein
LVNGFTLAIQHRDYLRNLFTLLVNFTGQVHQQAFELVKALFTVHERVFLDNISSKA